MTDCVFTPICNGECRCSAYLSANTDEGYALHSEYWDRVNKAYAPVMQWLEGMKADRLQEECE